MMILLPAYGRDYSSQKAVLTDFIANKDFILRAWGQPDVYINRQQILDRERVTFRYSKLSRVFTVTVKQS